MCYCVESDDPHSLFRLVPSICHSSGTSFNVPFKYQWLAYERWGKETGKLINVYYHICSMPIAYWTCLGSDIVHAELFGTHLVALNSEKVARDLLEKRSSIYSDRSVG
jgi:hypothetical protein